MAKTQSRSVSITDAGKVCYEVEMLCATKRFMDIYPCPEPKPMTPPPPAQHCPICAGTVTLVEGACASFFATASSESEPSPLLDRVLRNMAMESYLVHFRCLFEFITGKDCGNYGDCIFAGKFLDHPNTEWEKVRDSAEETFKPNSRDQNCWWTRVSKHLAHITVDRTDEKASWDIEDMHQSIMGFLKRFCEALPQDRKEWFAGMQRCLPQV